MLRDRFQALLKLNNSPPEIALGVAMGVFIAITPLYGFHTLMVIIAAFLIPKINKIAILLGTNVSIPPTTPLITWAGYEIGRFILKKPYPPLDLSYFKNFTLKTFGDLYYPLFIGSVVLGIICGAIFYFITLIVARRIKQRDEGRSQK